MPTEATQLQPSGLREYMVPLFFQLSGLSSMVLTTSEINTLAHHYKKMLELLQKLYPATPKPVVFFLGGSLPASALLHIAQLQLLGMMSRLTNNVLRRIVVNILSSSPLPPKSWFVQVNTLCTKYSLPSALDILQNPSSKTTYKHKVKSAVLNYWEQSLRAEASQLSSLKYFQANYYSLSSHTHYGQLQVQTHMRLRRPLYRQK